MTTEPQQQTRKNPFAFKKADPAAVIDPRADNIPDASPFALDIQSAQPVKGYTLGAVLASSDRTAIFKSHDAVMDRPVVVKMMRPFPGRDGVVEEFFSLAGSIARLRCTGVARGLDVGRADGNFYLVYEFLTGEDLDKKLAKRPTGKMTERESARLVREIALVLQELFSLGQPHGYLKPSNIMIADSRPRLADIGFAWSLAWPDDDDAFLHAARYLPPERLKGEINIDVRGDLYSLGAIWFRCLTGRDLFEGDSPEEMVRKHCEVRPPTAKSVDPKFTEETSKLIRWLLEKDRDNRPRTPKQFLRHLAAHPLLAGDVMDEDIDDGEALQELPEAEDSAVPTAEPAHDNDDAEAAGPIEITTAEEDTVVAEEDTVNAAVTDETAISIYKEYASASRDAPDEPSTDTAAATDPTDSENPEVASTGNLFSSPAPDASVPANAEEPNISSTPEVLPPDETDDMVDTLDSIATDDTVDTDVADNTHNADGLGDTVATVDTAETPEAAATGADTDTDTATADVALYRHYAQASQAGEQPYE